MQAAVAACLRALEAHAANEAVQEAGCSALASLAASPAAAKRAGAAGIDAALLAMKLHPRSTGVQAAGCRCLGNLMSATENLKRALRAGAADAVVGAMVQHAGCAFVQRFAAVALSNLIRFSPAVAARAASRPGALEALIGALRSSPAYGYELCLALAALANDPATCARAGALGAVEAVLGFAAAQPDSAEGLRASLGAIGMLALDNDSCARAVAGGAIETSVRAMRAHPAAPDLQARTLAVIGNSANCEPSSARAVAAGATAAVVRAQQAFPMHVEVQCRCAQVLGNLARFGDGRAVQQEAGAAGAMEALVLALGAFPSKEGVQRAGCSALAALAVFPPNRAGGRPKGGVEAVAAALQRSPRNAEAAEALMKMTDGEPGAKARAVAAGAIDGLLAALAAHPTDDSLVCNCGVALTQLCKNDGDNSADSCAAKARAGALAGMATLVRAMQRPEASAKAAEACAYALAMCATGCASNARAAGASGAVEVCVKKLAWAARGRDGECVSGCHAALAALMGADEQNMAEGAALGVRGVLPGATAPPLLFGMMQSGAPPFKNLSGSLWAAATKQCFHCSAEVGGSSPDGALVQKLRLCSRCRSVLREHV